LPADELQRISPYLEPVVFDSQAVLYEIGAPLMCVYFPRTLVASWLTCTSDGAAVESSTIGREGVLGLLAVWGTQVTFTKAVIQVPGEAVRIPAEVLRKISSPGTPLYELFCGYTKVFVRQLSQSVACNALHSVRQRCCRWLLTTQDRVLTDHFPLTQDVLARTLGVRRASVAEVARDLQRAGLIRYRRGDITIVNRAGLEAETCECYRVLKGDFDQLLGKDKALAKRAGQQ
jgi:CRP-like cAMP-binding protein